MFSIGYLGEIGRDDREGDAESASQRHRNSKKLRSSFLSQALRVQSSARVSLVDSRQDQREYKEEQPASCNKRIQTY